MSNPYQRHGCNKCPTEPEPHYEHPHHYHPPVQYVHAHQPHPVIVQEAPPCGCPAGPPGRDGLRGEKGEQGETGCKGMAGRDGRDGEQGVPGVQGIQGVAGPKGDDGIQGIQGEKGDQGVQGEQGIQGIQGETGIQGEMGLQGIQGDQGIQGIQGETGANGLDALISCTANEDNTCYDMVFRTPEGDKAVQLGGCVTLFSCGYTGTPQCETPTGAPTAPSTSGTQFVNLSLPRDNGDIILQDVSGATNTISNVTTSVEGDYSCVEWDQTGEVNFNIVVDTTGLPTATKGDITCYPPLESCLRLEAPAGIALNRKVGGSPVNNGWSGGTMSDGSVYDEAYDEPDYLQDFDQYVEGGVFSADFRGEGRMKVCYKHCFYEPVAAEVDLGGTIIEACNSSGVFTPDATTVLAE